MSTLCLKPGTVLANRFTTTQTDFRQRSSCTPLNEPVPIVTYSLKADKQTSDNFYEVLREFSNGCMHYINSRAETILHQYAYFVTEDCKEDTRSDGEYAVELLTLGITWRQYSSAAKRAPMIIINLLKILYGIRRKNEILKKHVDPLRGFITSNFLLNDLNKVTTGNTAFTLQAFDKFIAWLDATGEFKDEVKRFINWKLFFRTLTIDEFQTYMTTAIEIAEWFERNAKECLGMYTSKLDEFLKFKHPHYRGREDELFCGKQEVEYFVNMVASELMNQGLRSEFEKTKEKVVLVPACMSAKQDDKCKANRNGLDITCTGCTLDCNVHRMTELGKKNNFRTYIIPHSSRFTQWLKRWENTTEYGVVAIACPLNIAVGGYEMRELNIPSQCVMLDYCGCKKHWDSEGFPTDVNDQQVLRKISVR